MSVNPENVKLYLDYLDKEMTITGVLSTFCVAVPAVILERVASAEKNYLAELWASGSWYFMFASILMLIASGVFFKQRSVLAWYFGQVSLKMALPLHDTKQVNEWMKEADSWRAWIPYNIGFWLTFTAAAQYVIAVGSVYSGAIRTHRTVALIPVALFGAWGGVRFVLMMKYPYDDSPFRGCFNSLFKSRRVNGDD